MFTEKCNFSRDIITKCSLDVASEYIAIGPLSNDIANKKKRIIIYLKKISDNNTSEIEVAKILYFYHDLILLHFL